jgi:hypothetical protein
MPTQECADLGHFNNCTLQHCNCDCHEIGLCTDLGHNGNCTLQHCRCECHDLDLQHYSPQPNLEDYKGSPTEKRRVQQKIWSLGKKLCK